MHTGAYRGCWASHAIAGDGCSSWVSAPGPAGHTPAGGSPDRSTARSAAAETSRHRSPWAKLLLLPAVRKAGPETVTSDQ